tara:strand:- start:553 stop:1695 length:1143 start_codon:yes stop_codon:yes gene_type:complete
MRKYNKKLANIRKPRPNLKKFKKSIKGKYFIKNNKDLAFYNEEINLHNSIENLSNNNFLGSNLDDYFYGFKGNNTYQFGNGYDVIDYAYLPVNISLIRGGKVEKDFYGSDTFLDFFDKIIATNNLNDWIDGISDGGLIANLEVDLSNNSLIINNIPSLGNISTEIENFENIAGTNNADNLIGNIANNKLLGNAGNDFISGKEGSDLINGGDGEDIIYGGKGKDIIDGGIGNDFIYGGLGRDLLIGGSGNDTFFYRNIKESKLSKKNKLSKIDWIKNFNFNEDKIAFPDGVKQESFIFLGDLNYLSSRNINKSLKEFSYKDFDAIAFDISSTNQTFLSINGFGCGFQAKTDLLIEITGFSGDYSNLKIITDQNNIYRETLV